MLIWLCFDFLGPLNSIKKNFSFLLVVVGHFVILLMKSHKNMAI